MFIFLLGRSALLSDGDRHGLLFSNHGVYRHTQQILSKNLVEGQLPSRKMRHKCWKLFASGVYRAQNRIVYSDGGDRLFHRLH